ncbi:hypothetical protein COB64_03240 [Candidatus Wolfebacteria bacterium]|nr:MAG: hypothetical protein COB64_03240 [Candidatus Wolfebacteria bacterium]
MKIRTRIHINGFVSLILVIFLGALFILASQQLRRVQEVNDIVDEIVVGVFELSVLTSEYIAHGEEHTEIEWQLKHDTLTEIFVLTEFNDLLQKRVFERIGKRHNEMKSIFNQLLENPEKELEARLIRQLSVKSQSIVVDAHIFSEISRIQVSQGQQQINILTILFISLLIFILIGSSLYVSNLVSIPIGKLVQGAEIIGKGSLKHRIDIDSKDELGQLAEAFNEMTIKLKKSYSNLEGKVIEKTKKLEESRMELKKQIEDLERATKVMVGRELEMVEMKKRINELESDTKK